MATQREVHLSDNAKRLASTSNWPGAMRDPVEYGRGQIAALGYVSSNQAREIHILRLRNAFDRAGIGQTLRYVLNVLTLMREVEELKGGNWALTPPRFVPLAKGSMIIAPIPTDELSRHFAGIHRAGYARVLTEGAEIDLPRQSLDDWAGLEISDTKNWARSELRRSANEMTVTIEPQNVEFLYLRHNAGSFGTHTTPGWASDARVAAIAEDRTALCRSRLAKNYFRYFMGRLERGKVVSESPAPSDISRLQHGIAALTGRPITVLLDEDVRGCLVRIFSVLPRPERRVLFGLAPRCDSGFGKSYQPCTREHLKVITEMLQRLGCEIRTARV